MYPECRHGKMNGINAVTYVTPCLLFSKRKKCIYRTVSLPTRPNLCAYVSETSRNDGYNGYKSRLPCIIKGLTQIPGWLHSGYNGYNVDIVILFMGTAAIRQPIVFELRQSLPQLDTIARLPACPPALARAGDRIAPRYRPPARCCCCCCCCWCRVPAPWCRVLRAACRLPAGRPALGGGQGPRSRWLRVRRVRARIFLF